VGGLNVLAVGLFRQQLGGPSDFIVPQARPHAHHGEAEDGLGYGRKKEVLPLKFGKKSKKGLKRRCGN